MPNTSLIGPYLKRFLLEDVIGDKNLSPNSQRSYRDAIVLLLRFVGKQYRIPPDRLTVETVTGRVVRDFLSHLEKDRGNSNSTRNQRLTALHSLFRFIGRSAPEYVELASEVQAVPMRKTTSRTVPYLEKDEMDAMLAAPDRRSSQGRRDYALLLFLYNTGARADEAARLKRRDLDLERRFVEIMGKGAKPRLCPIWPRTVKVLDALLGSRDDVQPDARVFLNVKRKPITRWGIYALVRRTAGKAAKTVPSLLAKRVSPHVVRHYPASPIMPRNTSGALA